MRTFSSVAALMAVVHLQSVDALSWQIAASTDAASQLLNSTVLGYVAVGPLSLDGCNAQYVGGYLGVSHTAVIDGQVTNGMQGLYTTSGAGAYSRQTDITAFEVKGYGQQWVQDVVNGKLYVWGNELQDFTSNNSQNYSTAGAGQLWVSSDAKTWTQLLGAGKSFNYGYTSCFFKGSIFSYASTSPIYTGSAYIYDHNSSLRFTPGTDNAWVNVTSQITGLPDLSQAYQLSCTVTPDQKTMMLFYTTQAHGSSQSTTYSPSNTVYYSTDGVTFSKRAAAPWAARMQTLIVPVGADVLVVGGFTNTNGSYQRTYLNDTWSTSDAGQTWTQVTSSFPENLYINGENGRSIVLNEQLYIALSGSGNGYTTATLGTSLTFDQASCKTNVATTSSKVQGKSAASSNGVSVAVLALAALASVVLL